MTNKKFKVAAMSMALTACVAAQPLIANAADEVDSVSHEPAPQSEEGSSTVADTSAGNNTESNGSAGNNTESNGTESNGTEGSGSEGSGSGNESNQSDGTNMESTKTKEEAFGEHVDVNYNRGQSTTDKETGSVTTPGEVVKKDGTEDKKDETEDKKDETGDKKDETGGEKKPDELVPPTDGGNIEKDEKNEDKKIGDATITETPKNTVTEDPVPKPGAKPETKTDTKVTEDGTTIITDTTTLDATQTTTTTGSGHAKADTKETTKDTTDISTGFLKEELGNIDWDVEQNATVGTDEKNPYKVISKDEKITGDTTKQTLTLEKVEESSGHMTAEDIAKLVDADRDSVNKQEDGSYTLKRTETVTDKDGTPVTRTTYITVRKDTDEVSIKTTTTITVTREKVEHHEEGNKPAFEEDTASDFKLPDIALYDKETNKQVDSIDETKLNELIHNENTHENTQTKPDGTKKTIYTVTVKEGDVTREYEITKDLDSRKLTAGEIAARMGDDYEAKDGKVYYVGAGQRVELTVDQTNVIREKLSYTVKVKETKKDKETVETGKDAAVAEAKDEAVRDALKNAVTKMLEEHTITEDEATELNKNIANGSINAKDGGTFQTDITVGGVTKHFELDYSKGTITDTSETPRKDNDDDQTTDNKDLTANGSAYVTSGTVSWTDSKTGEGNHSNFEGKSFTAPDVKYLTSSTDLGGNKVEKIYTVVSEDGKTKTTTIYKVIEEDIQLSDLDENEKKDLAWKQLEKETKKSRDQLEKEGYKVTNVTFNGSIKKVSWNITETVTTTTTTTDKQEKDLSDIIYVDGVKKWTIDEEAGTITVDGKPYTITHKNADGSYTCDVIDADNKKTSYTFTEKDRDFSLTAPQVKALLVDQLKDDFPGITAEDIQLSTDGRTASYTKNGKTVTIDYSKLGKELKVTKDVHHSSSTTVTTKDGEDADAKFNEACEKLLKEIKTEILPKLDKDKGEELWIGNTHVTEDTTLTTDIMEYFTKAISSADMSNDEIINALEEQARVAKETDVKVNEGKTDSHGRSYEETLRNYYDGEKEGTYYVKPDGSTYLGDYVRWHRGKPYYYDSDKGWVELTQKTGQKDKYISHLDLASDSKLDLLPDEQNNVETTDCVLISKDLKLEWNYKADDLVKDKNNTTVSLKDKITFDSEDGKEGSGHYEYMRGDNYEKTLPTKSAYYKLTGTVVYDAVTGSDGNVTKYGSRKAAQKAYCDETGRAYDTVSEEDFAKYVVKVGDKYQVYTKSSQLEAYGYMTRDANTCVNQTYYREYDSFDYLGGYDLMISKLVQVREGKIVGQTESNTKTITAPWSIRTTEKKADNWLQLIRKTTETTTPTTTTTDPKEVGKGSNSTTTGDIKYNYTHDQGDTFDWTKGGTTSGVNGTGHGDYTSFVRWVSRVLNGGTGEHAKKGGTFHYKYDYTTVGDLQGEHLTQTVEKHAEVDYDYITEEVRNVKITDQEVTIITPDGGDDDGGSDDGGDEIIDEKDSDSPVLPGTPELPPVQDAKPDAPVLPADPALPAVQDAHALPQTGVNWLAAIGLALSGMTLMITGAFASLLGKNAKH